MKSIETALNKFEEAAISTQKATEQGDYKAGDKYYVVIHYDAFILLRRGKTA